MSLMSITRKKLQDKLRRKFGYRSNTNYNRGCILIKPDSQKNSPDLDRGGQIERDSRGQIYYPITDLAFCMDYVPMMKERQVEIILTKYRDYGPSASKKDRFACDSRLFASISLEELDLIHSIAHQMYEENKEYWDRSEKY